MIHGIVEAEDFAVDADGAGHPDFAAEGGGDPLGDAALAVARRREILLAIDERAEDTVLPKLQKEQEEQMALGHLEAAADVFAQAGDELRGTQWAGQLALRGLRCFKAKALLKDLEQERVRHHRRQRRPTPPDSARAKRSTARFWR